MLITADLDNSLWGAVVITANYLRNISPSSVLGNKSPNEVMYGKLPKISHLRIFGCKAYPMKLNNKDDKFEAVAKRNCIMIGYGDKEGIYCILDRNSNKVFRSRDIKFDEKLNEITELDISSNEIQEKLNGIQQNEDEENIDEEKLNKNFFEKENVKKKN